MKKIYLFILIGILVVIAGVLVGLFLGNSGKTSDLESESETKLASNLQSIENEMKIATTSNIEIKTSPNCLFVFEVYYKQCEHTLTEKKEILPDCVNKTEEELQDKYKEWKIKEFTNTMVTFYQEKDEICDEHYVIKDNDGYVAIYKVDSLGNETLKEKTEIVTTYLPDTDKNRLKEGIKVNGQEELNATIEDYE